MALDAATETIAHFAGLFEVAVEAPRLQIKFDAFEMERASSELAPLEPGPPIALNAPYEFATYKGSVSYEPDRVTIDETFEWAAEPLPQSITPPAPIVPPPFEALLETDLSGAGGSVVTNVIVLEAPPVDIPTLPTPPSVATVTIQQNYLSDNDLITSDGDITFAPLAPFAADLLAAQQITAVVSDAVLGDILASAAPTSAFAASVVEQLDQAREPVVDGLEATMLRGAEAEGLYVDGVAAEELPDWRESLPAALQPEEDGDSESGADADDSSGKPGVAVAGDPLSSDVASATADEDEPDGDEETPPETPDKDPFTGTPGADDDEDSPFDVDPGHEIVTGANQVINEAAVSYGWLDGKVISVAGDVIDVDVVSQQNLLIDRDGTSGEQASAAAAAPSLAAASEEAPAPRSPEAINAARISKESAATDDSAATADLDLPSFAAVTRIDGDVSLFNHIKQHNYLTDMDRAEVKLTASNSFIGTGENIAFNETLLTEIGLRFDMIMVGGDMLKVDIVDQVNVLLDNDIGNFAEMQAKKDALSDNLLMNRAVVESKSLDTYSAMQDAYAQNMQDFKDGMDTLSDEIMQDSLFAGRDLLTALYIEGNLSLVNIIEQRNYVGDQDQVHLARDAFVAETGAPITVTTGSNALLNAATITEHGVDSVVMAGGDTYSDALLYQAGFVDTDATPTGVSLPALANEAVAFLADGLVAPAATDHEHAPSMADDWSTPVDVMQTMLT